MFAVGLAVIIIGALAATFFFTTMGPGEGELTVEQKQTWFECSKCDQTFFLTPKTTSTQLQRRLDQLGAGLKPYVIDCQKCKARNRALLMLKCPNPDCGKRYVPWQFRDPAKHQQNKEKYPNVCPHCKMELIEAYNKANAPK